MSFGSVTEYYIALEEAFLDLKERAGVPRPCPRCGEAVTLNLAKAGIYWLECLGYGCDYGTGDYLEAEDAWREHERLCREAEENEG